MHAGGGVSPVQLSGLVIRYRHQQTQVLIVAVEVSPDNHPKQTLAPGMFAKH